MDDIEKQLEHIFELQKSMTRGMASEEDVLEVVGLLLHTINQLKQSIDEEMANNKGEMAEEYEECKDQISKIEESLNDQLTKLREKQAGDISVVKKQLIEEVNRLEDLIPTVKSYDYLEDKIKEVEAKIPTLPDPVNLTPFTEELNTVKEDVKKLKDDVEALKRRPRGGGGSGLSSLALARMFETIFHTETPTGAINGSNTEYYVQNGIWAIISITINGESVAELPNYSFINKKITFDSPLPAVYASKDFEIKYIGS